MHFSLTCIFQIVHFSLKLHFSNREAFEFDSWWRVFGLYFQYLFNLLNSDFTRRSIESVIVSGRASRCDHIPASRSSIIPRERGRVISTVWIHANFRVFSREDLTILNLQWFPDQIESRCAHESLVLCLRPVTMRHSRMMRRLSGRVWTLCGKMISIFSF